MLDAAWVLDNLHLVAEYHRHIEEGPATAPPSGDLLRLVQLLQWHPLDGLGDAPGSPIIFSPSAWWHEAASPGTERVLEQAYYCALVDSRRGVPLRVCLSCGYDSFAAVNLAVFEMRWELHTGRAMPSLAAFQAGGVSGDTLPAAPPLPETTPYTVERKLLGYALDASLTAGRAASFCISSELPGDIVATFERLICWDPDPRGPGMLTEPVGDPHLLTAQYQATVAGSCGLVDVSAGVTLTAEAGGGFTIVATVFPTAARKMQPQEGVMTWFACDAPQTIISAEFAGGTVRLGLTAAGRLQLVVGGRMVLETERPLLSRQWCMVAASCTPARAGTGAYNAPVPGKFTLLAAPAPYEWSADARPAAELRTAAASSPQITLNDPGSMGKPSVELGALLGVCVGATRVDGALSDFFNGKVAGPGVYGAGKDLGLLLDDDAGDIVELQPSAARLRARLGEADLFGCWDLSCEIPTMTMADVGPHNIHGTLKNTPTRAVKGPAWTGRHQVWTMNTSAEYDAVHFHEDDLTDCGWKTSLQLPLPTDLRSGVYALKLEQVGELGDRWLDYIPVFVRPARPVAKLCYLMPTVSMQCYELMEGTANVRGADDGGAFGGTTMKAISATTMYLRQLPAERCLGRSTYDLHNDGDGVKYASQLRPLLNSRPNELAWQFCAEAHVAAFLEAKGIAYDVVTDHQLHAEGVAALAPYTAVLSGTHPEYYTKPMMDALMRYSQRDGGRLLSIGANGYYWHVAFPPAGDPRGLTIAEMRRSEGGSRAWLCEPGEYYSSFSAELQGMWRRIGRPPQMLTGVGFGAQGFDIAIPYTKLAASEDPRAEFIFAGTGIEVGASFGERGLVMGGAAGSEIDRADVSLGTPRHALRLAEATDFPSSYHHVTEEQFHAHSATTGLTNELVRADMVFFETAGGQGAVWSTGSIAWGGALPINGFDNDTAKITENVIRRFIDPAPFVNPASLAVEARL